MADNARSPLASAFQTQPRSAPVPRVVQSSSLYVTEFVSDQRDAVIRGAVPQDDAYVVSLHLRTRPKGAMWAEGRWLQPQNFAAGNAGMADLRMQLMSEYAGPFHFVSFYLKRAMLDAVADDAGARRVRDLRYRLGVGFRDPVVHHLLASLRPALAVGSGEISCVYADHVALAFASHIACTYGDMQVRRAPVRGGLTPAQERRAKELLDTRLDGSLPLADLASTCQLSTRHFARAFRQSTGQSPHRWLTERRLDKARGMLESTPQPLTEIAKACGFASQSHFTRVFRSAMGMAPGAWRRSRRP